MDSELVERAAVLGREHGQAGGSEVTFGHPTGAMSARDCLELVDDPKWSDVWGPSTGPLSGEWADGLTPNEILMEIGAEPYEEDSLYADVNGRNIDRDELLNAYEDAYYQAWRDEVLRMAREQVES